MSEPKVLLEPFGGIGGGIFRVVDSAIGPIVAQPLYRAIAATNLRRALGRSE